MLVNTFSRSILVVSVVGRLVVANAHWQKFLCCSVLLGGAFFFSIDGTIDMLKRRSFSFVLSQGTIRWSHGAFRPFGVFTDILPPCNRFVISFAFFLLSHFANLMCRKTTLLIFCMHFFSHVKILKIVTTKMEFNFFEKIILLKCLDACLIVYSLCTSQNSKYSNTSGVMTTLRLAWLGCLRKF